MPNYIVISRVKPGKTYYYPADYVGPETKKGNRFTDFDMAMEYAKAQSKLFLDLDMIVVREVSTVSAIQVTEVTVKSPEGD